MCFACLVGRAYFILSKKNLKLVLNNAVLKGWKAAIRFGPKRIRIGRYLGQGSVDTCTG